MRHALGNGHNGMGNGGGGLYLNEYTLSFEFMADRALPPHCRLVVFQPDTSFMIPTAAFTIDAAGVARIGDECDAPAAKPSQASSLVCRAKMRQSLHQSLRISC